MAAAGSQMGAIVLRGILQSMRCSSTGASSNSSTFSACLKMAEGGGYLAGAGAGAGVGAGGVVAVRCFSSSVLRHGAESGGATSSALRTFFQSQLRTGFSENSSFGKQFVPPKGESFASMFVRMKSTAATVGEAAITGSGHALQMVHGSAALSHGLSDSARRQLVWWLGGSAAWVYSMVVLGGVTRLTKSGLSMTEWKFTGESPPRTQEDWVAEFDRYRASPEFKKIHANMTLEEFKFIFWMEYAHRMWGRLLGIGFVIPGSYFLARGYINGALAKRLGLLFFMGGTQGLVGWWMVRSGLEEPKNEWETPRVSPYRLAAHLVSAFAIYTTLVWTTLDLVYPKPVSLDASQAAVGAARMLRRYMLPLSALVAITATSGAFVAGMDAGRAYNTFPLMAGQLVPAEYWDMKGFANFFENTAAVQFNHRFLATATVVSVLSMWTAVRGSAAPAMAKGCMDLVLAVTAAQFGLGIWTLLEYVPVHLGSLHQANALNLFTAVLLTLHAMRPPMPTAGSLLIGRVGIPMGALTVACIGVAVTQNK